MKRLTGFLLAAVLLLGGCAAVSTQETAYRQISMEEAAELIGKEGTVLLDVRTEEEFRAGHIPGAICIPNETIGKTAPPELPDKDQTVYIYCRSGNRSKQAAEKLARLGYTDLIEIGGIRDWKGDIVTEKP